MMVCNFIIFCTLIAISHAYTTSKPNCTTPSTSVNFVSSGETRGTIDILWSCVFTIIACTWTVQHLNVPEQREDRDKGWMGDIKWALKRTFSSTKWMLGTAIAPEFLIAKNLGDLGTIHNDLEKLTQLAEEDEVPWSRSHSLFANMGGFVIRCNVPERVGRIQESGTDSASPPPGEPRDETSNIQNQNGTLQSEIDAPHLKMTLDRKETYYIVTRSTKFLSQNSNIYHLLAPDLVALREAGFLRRLPFIATAELNDRSKSDSLVRLIAIVQSFWIIFQIIVRAFRHLAVSQLEIAVAAFAVCAIAIYGLNWEKPKGVQTPYTILIYRGDIPRTVLRTVGKERLTTDNFLHPIVCVLIALFTFNQYIIDRPPGSNIPNHFSPLETKSRKIDFIQISGLLGSGMVFGAIHVVAWDFVFPTLVEKKLWWASSIICVAVPLASALLFVFSFTNVWVVPPLAGGVCSLILCTMYILARLFLLVEIFRTLCFLPPSAYVATWAANIMHVA